MPGTGEQVGRGRALDDHQVVDATDGASIIATGVPGVIDPPIVDAGSVVVIAIIQMLDMYWCITGERDG